MSEQTIVAQRQYAKAVAAAISTAVEPDEHMTTTELQDEWIGIMKAKHAILPIEMVPALDGTTRDRWEYLRNSLLESECYSSYLAVQRCQKLMSERLSTLRDMVIRGAHETAVDEYDEKLLRLQAFIEQLEDQCVILQAIHEAACKGYAEITGNSWVPPSERSTRATHAQTAGRASALDLLKRKGLLK